MGTFSIFWLEKNQGGGLEKLFSPRTTFVTPPLNKIFPIFKGTLFQTRRQDF